MAALGVSGVRAAGTPGVLGERGIVGPLGGAAAALSRPANVSGMLRGTGGGVGTHIDGSVSCNILQSGYMWALLMLQRMLHLLHLCMRFDARKQQPSPSASTHSSHERAFHLLGRCAAALFSLLQSRCSRLEKASTRSALILALPCMSLHLGGCVG